MNCKELETLIVEGSPLIEPPYEVAVKGYQKIFTYFQGLDVDSREISMNFGTSGFQSTTKMMSSKAAIMDFSSLEEENQSLF